MHCPREKRIRGNVTEQGGIKARCREKIAISRGWGRRLVSRTVLFRNRRSNPVAGISESDARDNGPGKNADMSSCRRRKSERKRELYLFYSVRPSKGWPTFMYRGRFLFFLFFLRGEELWWISEKWIDIEFFKR